MGKLNEEYTAVDEGPASSLSLSRPPPFLLLCPNPTLVASISGRIHQIQIPPIVPGGRWLHPAESVLISHLPDDGEHEEGYPIGSVDESVPQDLNFSRVRDLPLREN